MSATTPQTEESLLDAIKRMETEYLEKAQTMTKIKEELSTARDDAFKAFQVLTKAKEQYFITIINQQSDKINQLQHVEASTSSLPVVDEEDTSRANNIES